MFRLFDFLKKHFPKQSSDPAMQDIICNVKALQRQLSGIDNSFDLIDDADLIESCIYERNAVMARYRYFIKLAKESSPHPAFASRAMQPERAEKILG